MTTANIYAQIHAANVTHITTSTKLYPVETVVKFTVPVSLEDMSVEK